MVNAEALRAGFGQLLRAKLQYRLRSKRKTKFSGRGRFQDVAKGRTLYLNQFKRKAESVDRLNTGNSEAPSVNLAVIKRLTDSHNVHTQQAVVRV